jgi:hypothetical protein
VRWSIWVNVALLGVSSVGDLLTLTNNNPDVGFIGFVIEVFGAFLGLLSFIVCVVLSLMWLHQVVSNLNALGIKHRFSPGWSVGWWFVPIASLWQPYQVVRDAWRAIRQGPVSAPLGWWWAAWLAGNFMAGVGSLASRLDLVSKGLLLVAAVLWLRIVKGMTADMEASTARLPAPDMEASTARLPATDIGASAVGRGASRPASGIVLEEEPDQSDQ